MSLFKTRDWWKADAGNNEEFDVGCLCVANIDNSDDDANVKIIVGSLQGVLRVYFPKSRDFGIEDLLLEADLSEPILQLDAGYFTSSRSQLTLAVLHPRRIAVYAVTGVGDDERNASYYALQKCYTHALERTACNFTFGPFGGMNGIEALCVQSMDGQLTFVEHESIAFSRFLPNFLLPGPICYVPKTDCFITCSSAFDVQCYKYQVLATSATGFGSSVSSPRVDRSKERGGGDKGGDEERSSAAAVHEKKVQADWSVNIGEPALDIRVARFCKGLSSGLVDVVVLAERAVFCFSETGSMRLQKRLDYFPSSFCPFPLSHDSADSGSATDSLLVATSTGSLMVYQDMRLTWAAKTDTIPVVLRVGTFGGQRGMMVTLDDTGKLAVCYLGTEPPIKPVGGLGEGKELKYEQMDEEHRRLLSLIREATNSARAEPSERITLRFQVPTTLDRTPRSRGGDERCALQARSSTGVAAGMSPGSVLVRMYLSYTGEGSAERVTVTVSCPPPFACCQESTFMSAIDGGAATPCILPLTFTASTDCLPSSLEAMVVASYETATGEPRVTRGAVRLPLCLACQLIPPIKAADYKITLESTHPPPPLTAIFDDLVAQSPLFGGSESAEAAAAANVLTLQYFSGHDCTILVSKNANRYRLQSGTFEALWLVADELRHRLYTYYAGLDGARISDQGLNHSGEGGGGRGSRGEERRRMGDRGEAIAGGPGSPKISTQHGEEKPFAMGLEEPIPLQELFGLVDAHFAAVGAVKSAEATLEARARQLRVVQKRLLARFKDHNPAPLQHLDILFQVTYEQIMEATDDVASARVALRERSVRLSCGVSLVLLLARLRFSLGDDNFGVLKSHLCPAVSDVTGQGWEETTLASINHLLRTSLSLTKGGKEASTAPQVSSTGPLQDTTRLKKSIATMFDRLGKGIALAPPEVPSRRHKVADSSKVDIVGWPGA